MNVIAATGLATGHATVPMTGGGLATTVDAQVMATVGEVVGASHPRPAAGGGKTCGVCSRMKHGIVFCVLLLLIFGGSKCD